MTVREFRQQEPASGFDANALTRALRIAGAVPTRIGNCNALVL